jgi:4-amino-4-deoxy-L-arabinose transferase-like glycosyltransferase
MILIIKNKLLILSLIILAILYGAIRLYHLTTFPIFTDEAIYIRWSQIALHDGAWRFISLTDGKQPMYIWIGMVMIKLFQDPLFAGRFVSVLAGFGSLIGFILLGREVFKDTRFGIFSGFIYLLYPFALMYDRLALYDSLVAMFIIWSIYFSALLARHNRLDLGMILGFIIGGGMLTKTSANFGFILLPFSLLLFPFKKHVDKRSLFLWILYSGAAFLIANGMYNFLRLSPFFHIIGEKNFTFIYSFIDWIQSPFAYVFGNLKGLSAWLIGYLSIPFLLLIPASFFVNKKFQKEKLYLLIWFLVPFFALAFFGKVIYPRFILFMTMPLLLLSSYGLYTLLLSAKRFRLQCVIALVFLIQFIIVDYFILTDLNHAPIPQAERDQMITGWAGGTGVKETVAFLQKESKNKKIYVGTQGTFGLMPYALEIYFFDNPNVTIKSYWPLTDIPPADIITASKTMTTYVVFYQPCSTCKEAGDAPSTWPVTPVLQFQKPDSVMKYTLYQVINK